LHPTPLQLDWMLVGPKATWIWSRIRCHFSRLRLDKRYYIGWRELMILLIYP